MRSSQSVRITQRVRDMTALPVDRSPLLRKAVDIAKGLNEGTPMFTNPVSTTSTRNMVTEALSRTTDPTVTSTLTRLQTQITSLQTHTNRLVFGDTSALPTRGGLTRNIGQALAAIDLNDTLNIQTASAAARTVDPCALIQDFLGRILGAGAALLSAIRSVLRPILNLIGDLTEALTEVLGRLSSLASQILNLIANEIATFLEWIAKQINFGLARFLSRLNLPRNACAALALGAVATPALIAILDS